MCIGFIKIIDSPCHVADSRIMAVARPPDVLVPRHDFQHHAISNTVGGWRTDKVSPLA